MANKTTDENLDEQQAAIDENVAKKEASEQPTEVVDDISGADSEPVPQIPSNEVIVGGVRDKRRMVIVFGLIAILFFSAAAALILVNNQKQATVKQPEVQAVAPVSAAVTITASGFSPATIEIKKGQAVTWKNTDTSDHQPSVDPYPTNASLPEWGKGEVLKTNDEFTYVFDKSGTYSYHDNLNPYKLKGTVIVKD